MTDLLTSRIFQGKNSGLMRVEYILFHEQGDEKGVRPFGEDVSSFFDNSSSSLTRNKGGKVACRAACFGSLLSQVRSTSGKLSFNRIYYQPCVRVSKEQAIAWIQLATKMKWLPRYVVPEHLDTGFILKFGSLKKSKVPPSLLYFYLSILRSLDEFCAVVVAALHLVSIGINPFAALYLSVQKSTSSAGHHIINTYDRTCFINHNDINECQISLAAIIAIKRFIHNARKYDKYRVKEAYSFNLFSIFHTIFQSTPNAMVRVGDLTNPHVVAALEADSDEEIKQHIQAYRASKKK